MTAALLVCVLEPVAQVKRRVQVVQAGEILNLAEPRRDPGAATSISRLSEVSSKCDQQRRRYCA